MSNGTEERAQWDETAALEELERLRRSIEDWRKRRKDVQAEFEGFVRGFRTPRAGARVEPPSINVREEPAPLDARLEPPAISARVEPPLIGPSPIGPAPIGPSPIGAPLQTSQADVASPTMPAASAPASHESIEAPVSSGTPGSTSGTAAARIHRARTISVAGVLIALGAIGGLVFWLMQSPTDRPSRPAAAVPGGTAAAAPPAAAAAAPPPSAPDTAPRSAILALQRVWVRVVADGIRVVERELQAGERVPLRAGATSAIRAGNAGAVRLTIDGEDRGLLGPEGEVMTRTVKVPAPPGR